MVMEQGQIVEEGSYQELLNQRGKLWNYHQMQYEVGDRDAAAGVVTEASASAGAHREI